MYIHYPDCNEYVWWILIIYWANLLTSYIGVCLSHFSELETGDKQAFDTHNQTPIQTRIQTRFSDVVFIGPFLVHLVGDITRLSSYFSAQLQCAVWPRKWTLYLNGARYSSIECTCYHTGNWGSKVRNVFANQNGFAFIAVFLARF